LFLPAHRERHQQQSAAAEHLHISFSRQNDLAERRRPTGIYDLQIRKAVGAAGGGGEEPQSLYAVIARRTGGWPELSYHAMPYGFPDNLVAGHDVPAAAIHRFGAADLFGGLIGGEGNKP
jgi:hypothetical protein